MEATVVIPCRGHASVLAACLRSVLAQAPPWPYEVIVVDSASDDDVAHAARQFAEVRLIRSAEPLRAGPARNLGMEQARGRWVAFIDADCVAETGWLEAAQAAMSDERIRLAGGSVGDLRHSRWIASADNLLQFVDLPRSRRYGSTRYIPSCNMAIRTADFLAVGGFPDTHLNAGEDILLCNEVLARWEESLRFIPAMAVRHGGRATWREYLRHHFGFGYVRAQNSLHVRAWHLSWGRHAAIIPLVTLKRLGYVMQSGLRYRGWGVWRIIALLPLALPGLWASAAGFHRGCRERVDPSAASS